MKIVMPGQNRYVGSTWKYWPASLSIVPHDDVGGCTPTPRIRQGGLTEDVGGNRQRRVDEDRADQVRQDLATHDPVVGSAEAARGIDELLLAERQHLTAHDAPDVGEAEEAEHEDDHGEAQRHTGQPHERVDAAEDRQQRDREQQDREGKQQVNVREISESPSPRRYPAITPEWYTQDQRQRGGQRPDDQRGPGSVDQLGKDVDATHRRHSQPVAGIRAPERADRHRGVRAGQIEVTSHRVVPDEGRQRPGEDRHQRQ